MCKKTSDFLEKATWTLALALLILSLSTVFVMDDSAPLANTNENSELEFIKNNENAQPVKFNPTTSGTEASTSNKR